MEEKETLSDSYCEANITMIPKSEEIITHTQTHTHTQMTSQLSFRNVDAKILNKILASQIQQYIKRIIYHDQMKFIPGMQGWLNINKSINVIHHINKIHMIISIYAEKTFDKI